MPIIKMIGTLSEELEPETKSVSFKGKEYAVSDVLCVVHGKVTDVYEIYQEPKKPKSKKGD